VFVDPYWRFLFQACGNIKIRQGMQELDYVNEDYHMLEVSSKPLLLSSHVKFSCQWLLQTGWRNSAVTGNW
jgi:hypothetical protein